MGSDRYDVVVVGAGAAGLNAALVLTRARRRVAVVDGGNPRNAPAAHMHGFTSRDGTPPAELLRLGRDEVAGYGGELLHDHVTDVEPGFVVRLTGGSVLQARRLLVATGLRDELPDIEGVRERWAKDVLHCPYCHGWEVRDQPLGVIATSPAAVHQALLVRQWSSDVIFFSHTVTVDDTDRQRLAARDVRVVEGKVAKLAVQGDRLRGVELVDGTTVPRRAVFVGPRFVPHDDLLRRLGCDVDDDGWVVVDRSGLTSVPGVWAAGNVVDPRAQVVTAAGQGSAAAVAINADLVHEDVEHALRRA